MRPEQWSLYVQLHTRYAYGDGMITEEHAGHVAEARAYLERMQALRPFRFALLIGPGNAAEVDALKSIVPGNIVVLTAHEPEVAFLRDRGAVAELGDIHDLPYQHGVFDFLFCSNVLEHAMAPYIALIECRRVLETNAIAYFVMPGFAGPEGGKGAFHLHCLTQEVWVELLRKTGFVVADCVAQHIGETTYYHFVCTAGQLMPPHDIVLRELTTYKASRTG